MTTPDTSTMRAWARENGYDIADRGRVPAEVKQAYAAANGASAGSPKPARKAPAKKAPTSTRKATARTETAIEVPAAEAPAAQERPAPRPKPSLVSDDRRLVALGEEIAALSQRVAALEAASSGGKSGASKAAIFRRRS